MKKTYMHPEMKVVKIQKRVLLLNSNSRGVKSGDSTGNEYSSSDVSY